MQILNSLQEAYKFEHVFAEMLYLALYLFENRMEFAKYDGDFFESNKRLMDIYPLMQIEQGQK